MEKMKKSFEKRMKKLSHDCAILAWTCWIHPDVRRDTKTRFRKNLHGKAVERAIIKLYAHKVNVDLAKILSTFWKEHKMFVQENG